MHVEKILAIAPRVLTQAQRVAGSWYLRRSQPGPDHQVSAEQGRQQDAWQHTADKELGNRDLGGHAVDDHDDRRRDQKPQCAGAAQ